MLVWLAVLAVLAAGNAAAALPQTKAKLHLCLILPFGSQSYAQREVLVLLAAEHINTGNYTYVSNSMAHPLIRKPLEVTVTARDQGTADQAFDSAADCINDGADLIIGPAYSSASTPISRYLLSQRLVPAVCTNSLFVLTCQIYY